MVLIVDDEPDIRELLEITLNRMDIETGCAESIESAKLLLQQKSFSLCLTDMKLPDGNGLDLVDYIQATANPLPAQSFPTNPKTSLGRLCPIKTH